MGIELFVKVLFSPIQICRKMYLCTSIVVRKFATNTETLACLSEKVTFLLDCSCLVINLLGEASALVCKSSLLSFPLTLCETVSPVMS